MDAVKLYPVHSKALKAVGYDRNREVMAVQFKTGALYEYEDIPEDLYLELRTAPHPWTQLGHEVLTHRFSRIA